ncbi:Ribosome biogenesis ATPase rix7 [Mycoemilia scoparia]|uniref:Peroxisomal ATPase PEX1 n=1 Tax=Mycoemilia scoparia TaxID=417184 RepID=A0A9W7ZUA2_9FUNG|nr:Ribosome biogenesis ATPase rix7 [Mycoemilia scoparia]
MVLWTKLTVVPHIKLRLKTLANISNENQSQNDNKADEKSDIDDSNSVPLVTVKSTNSLNKSLTRLWANNKVESLGDSKLGAKERTTDRSTDNSIHKDPEFIVDTQGTNTGASTPNGTGLGEKRKLDADEKNRRRKKNKGVQKDPYESPSTRLSDLGGIESCIEEILELVVMPLKHPEIYLHTGVEPPRGVLLHGPPGCGKTMLANAIAGELGVPFIQISAPSVVSGMSGESEKKLRDIFQEAKSLAPCLVFIDEIDAITPKRETAQREMERRIVAQMLTCIDDLSWEKNDNKPVMMIGATNRPDSLDPALRRAGRFDREISLGVPDDVGREKILRILCKKLRLSGGFDYQALAKSTPGYVGADLNALTTAAGMIAVKRIFQEMKSRGAEKASKAVAESDVDMMDIDSSLWDDQPSEKKLQWISEFLEAHPEPLTEEELSALAITNADFIEALKKVQPSAQREGFATVPGVTWKDIGALDRIREELRMSIVEPIRHPEFFAKVGISSPSGVLLWGPPGCGKTLLAKAVANESHTNFISVKGPELLNKYVGESERAVRQVFARARASSPCVVFFDELDALCSRRDEKQSEATARVVNTLLTELDGVEGRKQVYVIAATNRPDMIDPAMLRPGRLDKLLYVELPTPSERLEILKTLTTKTPLSPAVDLEKVATHPRCDGYSGADLASLVREAAVSALRSVILSKTPDDTLADEVEVTSAHFETAFSNVAPSVAPQDKKRYDSLKRLYTSSS